MSVTVPMPTIASPTAPTRRQRLVSLDAFRGMTIAGMILVNNPGSWSHVYGPLRHAGWHGLTPTDLVFPFFLFIVGVAIPLAFSRRLEQPGASRAWLVAQVAKRSVILFLLGLCLAGFPDLRLIGPYAAAIAGLALLFWNTPRGRVLVKVLGLIALAAGVIWFGWDFGYFQESAVRVPGVLQRIAVCYFLAALIVLSGGVAVQALVTAVLLAGYWALVYFGQPPEGYVASVKGAEGLLHNWIDEQVLRGHLYNAERPDPEGLLSTLPALATTLCGALTGRWLLTRREGREKALGLFVAANGLLVAGLWFACVFPLNKKIWTSSYVLVTAGIALHFLGVCLWLIDVRGWRRWAWPFVVFGSNAIVVYVASSATAKYLAFTKVGTEGGEMSIKQWLYENLFASWAGPLNGSLLYPIVFVSLWLLPMIVLYRRRIFIKV